MIRGLATGIATTAALGLAGAAAAQTVPVPPAPPVQPASPAPPPLPAPDPARLAVAQRVVLKMFPPGSYREMLGENFRNMMSSMFDSVASIPFSTIAGIGGLTEDQVKAMGDAKMGEVMDILDPAWRERMKLMTTDLWGSTGDLLDRLEPRVREAMARAYAREFTVEQLNEILRFLETPTGARFAKQSLLVYTGRDVTDEMAALMPEIMKEIPTLMAGQQAKIEALPPRRRIEDLSDDERQRLASLLGVDVADLNEPELEPAP